MVDGEGKSSDRLGARWALMRTLIMQVPINARKWDLSRLIAAKCLHVRQESQFARTASSKMASSSSSHLPASVFNPGRHVGVHAERVSDVASTDFPGHYPGEDHSWSLEEFKKVCPVVSLLYFSVALITAFRLEIDRVCETVVAALR